MTNATSIPSHVALAWPALKAIQHAGGSATNSQITEAVAEDLQLTDSQRALTRTPRSTRTLLDYRLAWSRTLLKNMGAIRNDAPTHWSVTELGRTTTIEDIQAFAKAMLDKLQAQQTAKGPKT